MWYVWSIDEKTYCNNIVNVLFLKNITELECVSEAKICVQ